jgi:putative hemolysin
VSWPYALLVVVALIVAEAVFVAAEMALVSLREGQAKSLAERGRRGERVARLVADPNRFLGAVQIGVTTTALLSSAFGAVTLSKTCADGLRTLGMASELAGVISFLGVVLLIAYVTIVLGELVPKRLALQRAEGVAAVLGPPVDTFAGLSRPLIWLLSRSTDVAVRLFGGDPAIGREQITEEELRDLVVAHESLPAEQRRLISEVFEAGQRLLREVLTPRTEVEFVDAGLHVSEAREALRGSSHSRFPVFRGSHDEVIGVVHVRDLVLADPAGRIGAIARPVSELPDTLPVLAALSQLRSHGHLAVVLDEYGGTAGIVTLEDLVEELVGDISDEYDTEPLPATRLRGGEVEVEGRLRLDELADETGVLLPDGPYETVAGYVLTALGRLPTVGDTVSTDSAKLTVRALDGRRIARVLVTPTAIPAVGQPS